MSPVSTEPCGSSGPRVVEAPVARHEGGSSERLFLMAGGGTGGHVVPALAVAEELRARGHVALFVGTREGMEAKLVPAAGFRIEWIEIGGLQRVGANKVVRTLGQLPASVLQVSKLIQANRPAAAFSMGGYVAGPVVLAAWLRRLPVVAMEPNVVPGLTNRRMGRFVARALVSFPETTRYFPEGRTEVTGLPVRREFFDIPAKEPGSKLNVLITGGSRGSKTLNRAVRESWPLFRESGLPVRLIHQAGRSQWRQLAEEFVETGLDGEVVEFVDDMPAAFAEAGLIVCRSGAGAVAELAAAGRPSILVPFPYATDDHQLHNAEAMAKNGASLLVTDQAMSGKRLFDEVSRLASEPGLLRQMGAAARSMAKPGAAIRAAEVLEELA